MRRMFCPICAAPIEERGGGFSCDIDGRLAPALGHSLRRAVYNVEPPTKPPRKPALAPYLWCPSCTGELEDYDDRQRRLKCVTCGLRLPTDDQMALAEMKEHHRDPADDEH